MLRSLQRSSNFKKLVPFTTSIYSLPKMSTSLKPTLDVEEVSKPTALGSTECLESTSNEQSYEDFTTIVEGSATMNYDKREAVFYNKVQVFNRDISIQVIRLFASIFQSERQSKYKPKLERYEKEPEKFERAPFPPPEGISVLDALAATGLRSVRYLKEIPGVRHVTINDLDENAVNAALANCRNHAIEDSRVSIHHGDAALFMYQRRESNQQFDVIDLDPYGSASPFLDAAVQAVADGGLLCVTCTDTTVLTGKFPEVCFSKYGSIPIKNAGYKHEMSLRILLHAIDAAANKYKRYIEPWVSLSVDFYVRVFVRVRESPLEVKQSALRRTMVHQSLHCASYYLQPLAAKKKDITAAIATAPTICPETGGPMRIGGPFWEAPIHSQAVVDELLRRVSTGTPGSEDLPHPIPTHARVHGMLILLSEELKGAPLFYTLPELFGAVKSATPPTPLIKAALAEAGYKCSQFHHEPFALKTDAPPNVIWDIVRLWAREQNENSKLAHGGKKEKKSKETISSDEIDNSDAAQNLPESSVKLRIHVKELIMSRPNTTNIRLPENRSKWTRLAIAHSNATAAAISEDQNLDEVGTLAHTNVESIHENKTKVKPVARFPPNPERDWGPKRRAGSGPGQSGALTKTTREHKKRRWDPNSTEIETTVPLTQTNEFNSTVVAIGDDEKNEEKGEQQPLDSTTYLI